MDISIVFRIAAVGVLVAVLNQVLLRAGRDRLCLRRWQDWWLCFFG